MDPGCENWPPSRGIPLTRSSSRSFLPFSSAGLHWLCPLIIHKNGREKTPSKTGLVNGLRIFPQSILGNPLQRFTRQSWALRSWRLRPLLPQTSRLALHICRVFAHPNSTSARSVSGCILEMPYPVASQAIARDLGMDPNMLSRWRRETPWVDGRHEVLSAGK